MKAIVTVKRPRNPRHDPKNKMRGNCPLLENKGVCTDITGQHHSYIQEGKDLADIERQARVKHQHVTRIEEIIEGH